MKTRQIQRRREAGSDKAQQQAVAGKAENAEDGSKQAPDAGRAVPSHARIVRLEAGLHALIVGHAALNMAASDLPLPATFVTVGPTDDRGGVTIMSVSGGPLGWLGAEGGSAIANVGAAGGVVLVTTYGLTEGAKPPDLRVVDLRKLIDTLPAEATPDVAGREIPIEITLHIERQGDRRYMAQGWQGSLGRRLRIEGFGLRPLEGLTPSEVEYMGFGPAGQRTPWVSDAKLCGTRGRGIPMTGFAIRLAPALRDRFDVIYEGAFFNSGTRGPVRNGEPCEPLIRDDPLEAIRVRLVEHASE